LNASLANAQFSNNCAELGLANNIFPDAQSLLTYFEYEIKDLASTFENMDACESFSGRVSDRNKDNVGVVLSAMVAGLYPNIAQV
jgi:hypothetical protein